MKRRPRGNRRSLLVLPLLLALMTLGIGPATVNASASQDWWNPVSRPVPDSQINVAGEPSTGTDAQGRVRGFIDAHVHLMANEGFGGRLLCGQVFSEGGVADALKDCPEHYPDGSHAIFDYVIHGGDGKHDPVGWPTFNDWPAYDSVTHTQTYYAWIERAWRGGQRVLVNDLVTNNVICSAYFFKDRSCDEMTAIRLEAQKTYDLQAYIDRMYGGPGKGWFRIVTDTDQARDVIGQGKLAVVLGVETSEPFGCKQILDVPQCSREDIERGLDELYGIGVRSMFLCHKFDNALCGVRFDSGALGVAVDTGQFLSTGTFWATEKCTGAQHDNPIGLNTLAAADAEDGLPPGASASELVAQAQQALPAGVSPPAYSADAQCNTRGLTDLGVYALSGMMKRHMMLEVDHMSVKAVNQSLAILDQAGYPGVISSHSWMDTDWTERLYRLGGFVAQHIHDAPSFAAQERQTAALRQKYQIVGYGIGTDMNGISEQPGPRAASPAEPVQYPFRSPDGGSVLDRQTTGQRTWDINSDGVAHYGLVPDWVEDVRVTGGQDVVNDLMLGAEGYLRTWGATERHTADRLGVCGGSQPSGSAPDKDIRYQAHVADIGWQSYTGENGTVAGTTGLSDSVEAVRLSGRGAGGLWVRAHVQNIGWQPWQYAADGQQVQVGTTGQGLRLEALEVRAGSATVGGQGHVQNLGWTAPVKGTDIVLGTTGQGLRLEALALSLC